MVIHRTRSSPPPLPLPHLILSSLPLLPCPRPLAPAAPLCRRLHGNDNSIYQAHLRVNLHAPGIVPASAMKEHFEPLPSWGEEEERGVLSGLLNVGSFVLGKPHLFPRIHLAGWVPGS